MKAKLFSLLFAVVASIGTMSAWDYERTQIGDLFYNLDVSNQIAEVTSEMSGYPYWSTIMTAADIPVSVTYSGNTYSVTSIGDGAFFNCGDLISVTIPHTITSIGDGAFYDCRINEIHYTGTIQEWMEKTWSLDIVSYHYTLYIGDAVLNNLVIPNTVTSIGNCTFYGCSSLTSVTIPNSVTGIGNNAFYGCSGLTSVTIPNSVTSIGYSAFYNCSGLTTITIPSSATNNRTTIEGIHNLKIVNAPASFFDVQEEKNWMRCPKYLEQVTVNSGELNDNAFSVISRSYKTLKQLDFSGVSNTDFANEAVKGYYSLTSLALPANTEIIGYMAVAECVKLQSIEIPAGVTEIDDRAFENCRSLKTITFGSSANPAPGHHNAPMASTSQLERIGNWAFYNCHELQSLEIPEGVTEIGDGAFYGCTYLQDLSLPSSVRSIGDNCFALCSKLKMITVNSTTPPQICPRTFYDVSRQIPVYVPEGVVADYKNDDIWGQMNIQGMETAVENISACNTRNTKLLIDGQLFILRGDKTYSVQGQEVW